MTGRPRIGISLDTGQPDEWRRTYELGADYAGAVVKAGGVPVLLAHSGDEGVREEMAGMLDGLIIPGGDDMDARLWGESQHATSRKMDRLRQDFDMAMLGLAERRNMPTLGICLGCQMMNVVRGGSLHQNLVESFPESAVRHAKVVDPEHYNSSFHHVMLRPGTRVFGIFGKQDVEVNSRHRQAINKVGRGLIATGFAPDGILEAIEDYSMAFWVGVQWHPENMEGTLHERLFGELVKAAGKYKAGRKTGITTNEHE